MLKTLHIKNFVLIEELSIDLSGHLTTITGETGAGKSILLGALNLILGQRADTTLVADEDKTCVIEGIFDIEAYKLESFFESEGLEFEPVTVLRREIRSNGKSRAFINDNLVNLATLKNLADHLIDIHEQFDSQFLRERHFQFQVLDSLAEQLNQVEDYQKSFLQWWKWKSDLKDQQEKRSILSQKKEFLEYQLEEIRQVNYQNGEFGELEEELNVVKNAADILDVIQLADQVFGGSENNLLDQIRSLISRLAGIKVDLEPLKKLKKRLESNYIEMEDLYADINQLEDLVEINPGRSEWIENRLAEIFKVVKKHQLNNAENLSEFTRNLEDELEEINQTDSKTHKLEDDLDRIEKELFLQADRISVMRMNQVESIRRSVLEHLAMLNLENADFKIQIDQTDTLNDFGRNEVRFLFSANPGVKLAPVDKVASGGEISRLALAIKALIARSIPLPTIVFDEIDAAVSGSAADKMGRLLYHLSRHHQVICITHSPQVASRADKHLFVYKQISGQKTETRIRELLDNERVRELAIMMSSDPPSRSALDNAKYLLEKMESH